MDLEKALGAEFRVLSEREFKGKPARVIAASRIYQTSMDDLWDAITNKERLPRWFGEVEGTLEFGGKYKIKGNAKGKITRCDPPNALDLTWEIFFDVSWLQVRLTPESNGTLLSIEHIMRKGRLSERHWKKYGPGATGVGWDFGLLDLGLHLAAGGADIDRAVHDSWMASADGKAFVHACAAAWGKAHVEAGESEVVANNMAKNTANFYSGT